MLNFYSLHNPFFLMCIPVVACLLILVTYLLRWRHYRLLHKYAQWQHEAQEIEVATHIALYNQKKNDQPIYPKVSIVIPSRDQADQLKMLLPKLLEQEYKGNFEVIVVDEKSSDETSLVIKQFSNSYKNLRQTYVPATSRHIELRKLAITLGIKASFSEWVIILNPDTIPDSKSWLQHYAENLQPGVDFIRAYYNYDHNGTATSRCAIIERLRQFAMDLAAYEKGLVLNCETANYAVRKNWFIEQQGFADSLTLPFGEEKIFACYHATTERTTMLCSSDTCVTELMPTKRNLYETRMYASETKKHLKGITKRYTVHDSIATISLYLCTFIAIAYILLRVIYDINASHYSQQYIYTDIFCLFIWLCLLILPTWMLRIGAKAVNQKPFGIYIYLHEMLQPWRNISIMWMRYIHKSEFKRNFIN